MALTPSTMLDLGTPAPDFELLEVVSGQSLSLATLPEQPALLVMFICCHCPFVKHVREQLTELGQDYSDRIGIVAISANDVDRHPDDSPQKLKEMAQSLGWSFPVLYDESQEVAKSYTAACTPDFFLFDRDRRLAYRGQLDGSRPSNNIPVTGEDLREAIEALLAKKPVNPTQLPSIGCNIKWKSGNEPTYYGLGG
ncbi:thioredoxin family protein [Synechococcus sp. PCC 7336]|uniref:thioredoxin family protein n=1 Tax=Synechococcus sp. PCC 7336 TaxID=195250 RepID=UPI00034D87F4|nr:thioredoxin family protein [Synechococcus sp. PCC 7336]